MLGTSPITSLLQSLEGNQENYQVILDEFIKNVKKQIEMSEEFQKEFQRIYKNSSRIYQIIISDINHIFYLRISLNKVSYIRDLTEIDSSHEQIIPIVLTKDAMISILKREESISTLYMRGVIVIKDGLSEVIKIRNFIDFYYTLFVNDN